MNNRTITKQATSAIRAGIPEDELFTPIMASTGKRVVMRVENAPEVLCLRTPGLRGEIRDQLTGIRYMVYGRECGLWGCWCDAEVIPC